MGSLDRRIALQDATPVRTRYRDGTRHRKDKVSLLEEGCHGFSWMVQKVKEGQKERYFARVAGVRTVLFLVRGFRGGLGALKQIIERISRPISPTIKAPPGMSGSPDLNSYPLGSIYKLNAQYLR